MTSLLPPRDWYPANHAALRAFLNAPSEAPRLAVFDWDNTCIFNDIGDASFRYQCEHLALRLTPEALAGLLPDSVGGLSKLAGDVVLADLNADIRRAYAELWPGIAARRADSLRGSGAHLDLRAKLGFLYTALTQTPEVGAHYAYSWLACLWAGFTSAEVRAVAAAAARAAAGERVGGGTWHSVTRGASGKRSFTFQTRAAPHAEMLDLMAALQSAGIVVYVVTASQEAVVQGAAAQWQAPVAEANILGVRLAEEGGVLLPRRAADYPFTYRQGKVDVIRQHLPGGPVLVAGDTNTDYEMLTSFAETRIRLVINRNSSGDIRKLYAASSDGEGVLTLLQGRDENGAKFRPGRETIALGHATPTVLAPSEAAPPQ